MDVTGIEEVDAVTSTLILKGVAQAPIERGGETGPAGYAKAILNARKMVCMPESHESCIDRYIGKNLLQRIGEQSPIYYKCPNCSGIV
jgi:hypothetical protein